MLIHYDCSPPVYCGRSGSWLIVLTACDAVVIKQGCYPVNASNQNNFRKANLSNQQYKFGFGYAKLTTWGTIKFLCCHPLRFMLCTANCDWISPANGVGLLPNKIRNSLLLIQSELFHQNVVGG